MKRGGGDDGCVVDVCKIDRVIIILWQNAASVFAGLLGRSAYHLNFIGLYLSLHYVRI